MTLDQFAAANPSADPAETIRNYRNQQHLELLKSGEYDDLAPELDTVLQEYAATNGIEVDFTKRNDRKDLEYVSQYSEDPAAQAAARTYLAVDDPKIKDAYGDPVKYDEVLTSARVAVEQSVNPIERNKARRVALDSGDTPFAVFQDPTTGEERLDVSTALKDLAGNDEALAAYFEANPDLDVSRIPEIRQKLKTPDGFTVPAFQIDRQHDWMGAFTKVIGDDKNIARKVSDLRAAADKGTAPNEALLDQIDTELGAYGLPGDPDERKTFIKDFINMSAAPEVDEENLDNNIRTLSTGQKVLPMAVMLQRPLFDKVVESPNIPESQRTMLKENRDAQISAMAPEMFKTIAANRPMKFPRFMQERKDKGLSNAAILDEWMADPDNYSQARSYLGGVGESVLEGFGGLVAYPAAMMGSESARKALSDLQKSDMDRRNYAQMFGKNLGTGYDLARLVAPVAADVSVSLLTGGAATAAITSKNIVKTGIKSALKGAVEAGAYKAFTRGAATQSVDRIIDSAGKNLARKFVKTATTASYLGTAFNRSAGSTYVQLYSQLSEEKNPDGSAKYTPEKAREIALNHGLIQGSLTALITGGFSFLGRGGIESIYGNVSRKQMGRIFDKVKQDFDQLAPSVRAGLDVEGGIDEFITSVAKKAVRPMLSEVGKGFKDEALEEGLDQFAGYFNQQIATGDQINIADAFKQAGYAAMLGGVMGGTVVGINEAVSKGPDEAVLRRTALYDIAAKLDAASSPQTAEAVRRFAVEGFPTPAKEVVPEGTAPAGSEPTSGGPAVAAVDEAEVEARVTVKKDGTVVGRTDAGTTEIKSSGGQAKDIESVKSIVRKSLQSAAEQKVAQETAPADVSIDPTGAVDVQAEVVTGGENQPVEPLTPEQEEQAVASSMPGQKVRIGARRDVKQRVVRKSKPQPQPTPTNEQNQKAETPTPSVQVSPVPTGQTVTPSAVPTGSGAQAAATPEAQAQGKVKLSNGAAQTIIATRQIGNFSGQGNADIRATIMSELTGKKVAKSKAGYHAFVDTLAANYGITKDDKTIAAYEKAIVEAVTAEAQAPVSGPDAFGITPDWDAAATLAGVEYDELFKTELEKSKKGDKEAAALVWRMRNEPAYGRAAYQQRRADEMVQQGPTPAPEQGLTEIPNIEAALYEHPESSNATEEEAQLIADALNPELSASPELAMDEAVADGKDPWGAARRLISDIAPNVDVDMLNEQAILDMVAGHPTVQAKLKLDTMTQQSINAVNRQLQGAAPPKKAFTEANSPVTKEIIQYGGLEDITRFLNNVVAKGPKHQKAVAKLILEFGNMLGTVPIAQVHLPNFPFSGAFIPETGQILINTAVPGPRGAVDTVLHELLHAATTHSIANPTPAQQKVLVRLERIRQSVKKRAEKNGMDHLFYGLGSIDEMVSHWFTSTTFQADVSALTPKGERNWVQVIIEAIKDLLNGNVRTQQDKVSQEIMSDMIEFTRDAAQITYPSSGKTSSQLRTDALMLPAGYEGLAPNVADNIVRLKDEIIRLTHRIDAAYETGKTQGVEKMESRLEEILEIIETDVDAMEGQDEDNVAQQTESDMAEYDSAMMSPEEFLVDIWMRWNGIGTVNSNMVDIARRDFTNIGDFARSATGDNAYVIRPEITDQQIEEAAEEAFNAYSRRRDAMRSPYGPTPRMDALMQLHEGDVRNTARFIELTRGVTPENVEQWRAENPEAYAELRAMREEVLRDAGWDVGPLLHGTEKDFTEFVEAAKPKKNEMFSFGFHFTDSEGLAGRYGKNQMSAMLKVKNPLDVRRVIAKGDPEWAWLKSIYPKLRGFPNQGREEAYFANELDSVNPRKVRDALREAGYDALIYDAKFGQLEVRGMTTLEEGETTIVLDPNQIKSTEPIAFDSDNQLILPHRWADAGSPDIRFQLPDPEQSFNNEIQNYVTGNWPADAQGRYDELKRFTDQWTVPIAQVFAIGRESDSQPPPPGVTTGKLGAGAAAYIRDGNEIAIYIGDGNLKAIAADTAYGEVEAKKAIAMMIQEEVAHAAYFESVRRKKAEGESLVQAIMRDTKEISDSLLNATENRDGIAKALYASAALYNPSIPRVDAVNTEEVIRVISEMPQNEQRQVMSEFMRQIVQMRRIGSITETGLQKVIQTLRDWFDRSLQVLRDFASRTEQGGARFAQAIAETESILREIEGDTARLQIPTTENTPDIVRAIAAGFTPDDADINLDIDALTEATTGLNPVNREHLISAAVNRALSIKAGFDALGEEVTPDERERLTRMHQMILSGNTLDSDIGFYRSNPTAMQRLVRFLTGAVKAAYARLKLRFDNRTAIYVDRMTRELSRAKEGYRTRSDRKMFDPEDPDANMRDAMMQLPEGDVRNTARFIELTRGVTPENVEQWRRDNPEAYQELRAMREEASVDAIKEAMGDATEFWHYGLRSVDESYVVGDVINWRSSRWDDGDKTDEELSGVSSVAVDGNNEGQELKSLKLANTYGGSKTYLLGSDEASGGEDPSEIILDSPKVLAILDPEPLNFDSENQIILPHRWADAGSPDIRFQLPEPGSEFTAWTEVDVGNKLFDSDPNQKPRNWWGRMFKQIGDTRDATSAAMKSFKAQRKVVQQTIDRLSAKYQRALKEGADIDLLRIAIGSNRPMLTMEDELAIEAEFNIRNDEAANIAAPRIEQAQKDRAAARRRATTDEERDAIEEAYTLAVQNAKALQNKAFNEVAEWERTAKRDRAMANAERLREQSSIALEKLKEESPIGYEWAFEMRKSTDEIQAKLAKHYSGSKPELAWVIDNSQGVYLVRTFNFHRDPTYAEKLLHSTNADITELRDRMIDFFGKHLADIKVAELRESPAYADYDETSLRAQARTEVLPQATKLFEDYVMGQEGSSAPAGSGLHDIRTEFQRFLNKKDHPKEILELLGEIDDPLFNSTRTFASVTGILFSQRMLSEIRRDGLKSGWLIDEATKTSDKKYSTWKPFVAANEKSQSYAPLAGLYAEPKDVEAIQAALNISGTMALDTAGKAFANVQRALIGAAGTSMGVMTLGSVGYFSRNIVGNTLLALAQGVNPISHAGWDSAKLAYLNAFGKDTDADVQELIARRILGDGTNVTYLKEFLQKYREDPINVLQWAQEKGFEINQKALDALNGAGGKWSKLVDVLSRAAEFTETFQNPLIYFNEFAALMESGLYEGNEEGAKQEAARRTKMVTPGTTEVPQIITGFSKNPLSVLVAPFVRFKAEMLRTTWNTYVLAMQDIKSGNETMRDHGINRMTSALVIHGAVTIGLPLLMQAVLGISDEEDEAIRKGMPAYSRHSTFIYFKDKKTGELTTLDLSFANPFSFVFDSFTQAIKAGGREDYTEIPAIATRFVTSELLGEQIVSGKVMDVSRNVDESTGLPIYLRTDNMVEKFLKSSMHVLEGSYAPQILKKSLQAVEATNRPDKEDEPFFYTPLGILVGHVAPVRPRSHKAEDLAYRAFRNVQKANSELWQVTNRMSSPAPLDPEDVKDIYEKRKRAGLKVWQDMYRTGKAFQEMGLSEQVVAKQAIEAGLSKKRVGLAMNGFMERPLISPDKAKDIREIDERRLDAYREAVRKTPQFIRVD